MNAHNNETPRGLVIVDPRPEDYATLLRELDRAWVSHLIPDGHAALKLMASLDATEWLINVRLPDMDGAELLKLVRQRRPQASIALVADRYLADEELTARSLGAAAFLCKPAHLGWLSSTGARASPASSRAGPLNAPG